MFSKFQKSKNFKNRFSKIWNTSKFYFFYKSFYRKSKIPSKCLLKSIKIQFFNFSKIQVMTYQHLIATVDQWDAGDEIIWRLCDVEALRFGREKMKKCFLFWRFLWWKFDFGKVFYWFLLLFEIFENLIFAKISGPRNFKNWIFKFLKILQNCFKIFNNFNFFPTKFTNFHFFSIIVHKNQAWAAPLSTPLTTMATGWSCRRPRGGWARGW